MTTQAERALSQEGPVCRFSILQPPSTNNLHGSHVNAKTGKQRRHKTAAYKAWIDDAGWEMKRQGIQSMGYGAGGGSIRVLIEGVKRMDVDNIKAIPDLCKRMGIIADDKLIDDLQIVRRPGEYPGLVTVSIWVLA